MPSTSRHLQEGLKVSSHKCILYCTSILLDNGDKILCGSRNARLQYGKPFVLKLSLLPCSLDSRPRCLDHPMLWASHVTELS